MDQIVGSTVAAQILAHSAAEGKGFGETAAQLAEPLDRVGERQQVARPQRAQALREQIETGNRHQTHARVQLRIGRPREHVDAVPRLDQRLAQIVQINALAAAVRLASIAQ